ncbi:MAG TPA: hypothetical protein VMI72_08990 [Roseiarcus sp.]|nr:hypothetical protein [Roseiarcus sp.]
MMREDFDAIPKPPVQRGSVLAKIYHDIGLAAVADALNLQAAEFDADLRESLERGDFYVLPSDPKLARTETVA